MRTYSELGITLAEPIVEVHWRGPFTRVNVEAFEKSNGLYLFSGKAYRQRKQHLLYCGITTRTYHDRFREHHKIVAVRRDLEIWLGAIVQPHLIDGNALEKVEQFLIYATAPPLNQRHVFVVPAIGSVVSYWFSTAGEKIDNPFSKILPTVLTWDGTWWYWSKP